MQSKSLWQALHHLAKSLDAIPYPTATAQSSQRRKLDVEATSQQVQDYMRSLKSDVREFGRAASDSTVRED